MNQKTKGYILGTIAAATYGMNPLFALPLYKDGMNPESVLFFRYLLAIPILAVMIHARGRSFRVNRKETLTLIVMGYPIMVAVIMALAFKEKISLQTGICMLMALGGIALLYKGTDGATLSITGTVLALTSALTYAIYIVGINQTTLKNTATLTVTFYVLVFGVSLFVIRLLTGTELTIPSRWYMWANLIALAVFPTAVSFLCTTSAIQYIGSTPTAILGALEPVTAIFFGITIFGERMTLREGVGIIMILLAVTLVIAGGSITLHMTRFRKMFPKLTVHNRQKRNR